LVGNICLFSIGNKNQIGESAEGRNKLAQVKLSNLKIPMFQNTPISRMRTRMICKIGNVGKTQFDHTSQYTKNHVSGEKCQFWTALHCRNLLTITSLVPDSELIKCLLKIAFFSELLHNIASGRNHVCYQAFFSQSQILKN